MAWSSWKLYNDKIFDPEGKKKRAGRRETGRHAALGTDLVLDGPGLRGIEGSEMYETRKSRKWVWSRKKAEGPIIE